MTEENQEDLEELYKDESEELKEKAPDVVEQSVDDFIQSEEPAKVEEEETKEESGPEVKRDTTFDDNPAGMDSIMREVMIDTQEVDITHSDKTKYLKAVLNDAPVVLDIELCAGQIVTEIRSRTSWEQTCLYATLQKDQEEGVVKDLASVIIQLQKYGCCLMMQKVDEKVFSTESIPESCSIPEAIEKLRALRIEKIEPLSMPKWGLLLNALRLFETKLAQMGTECLNENFWEPAS